MQYVKEAVVLALWLSAVVRASNTISAGYMKVTPSFPADVEDCVLEVHRPRISITFACAALCASVSDCHLYCVHEGECTLLEAKVTQYWDGTQDSTAFKYTACYSSWAQHRDVGGTAVTTSSPDSGTSSLAVDGYYCRDKVSGCFLSGSLFDSPWWMADLVIHKTVTSVRVQSRAKGIAMFENVVVSVGNSTNIADSTVLDTYPGSARGEVVDFVGSHPITGRYVYIQEQVTNMKFAMGEVQIVVV